MHQWLLLQFMYSWWWTRWTSETCRVFLKLLINNTAKVTSSWFFIQYSMKPTHSITQALACHTIPGQLWYPKVYYVAHSRQLLNGNMNMFDSVYALTILTLIITVFRDTTATGCFATATGCVLLPPGVNPIAFDKCINIKSISMLKCDSLPHSQAYFLSKWRIALFPSFFNTDLPFFSGNVGSW